jgi:hypothetical protein
MYIIFLAQQATIVGARGLFVRSLLVQSSQRSWASSSSSSFSSYADLVLDRLGVIDCEALRRKHNVELELAGGGATGALVLAGGRVVLDGVEVNHQVVPHGEDSVGSEPGIVLGVDLCDDGLVVLVGDLLGFS